MLSLSNGGMTAGHAGKYFSREDYYLKGEEPSQWLGKSAAVFRLRGKVKEAAFRNLASGKSPDGLRQLVAPKITKGEDGAQVENHRAGNDLTFSAPKSVSIGYAAGNRELKEIWDQAVVNTMQYVEKHYSHYRTPDGVESAGNIIAAKFDHVTSRALDPEVHSHVFLLNMVQTPEGWQANEPKNIYQDKIALGMLARQEAINLYRKAGYRVDFTDREKLLFEIEGVRREEIDAFSKRRSAILDKVSRWKEEQRFPGVADTLLKQMAALDTRDSKRQVTQEDVRRAWEEGFTAAGTTPEEVKERIEAFKTLQPALEQSGHPVPGESPSAIIKTAASLLTEREVLFDRTLLLKTAVPVSGGGHSIAELDEAVDGTRSIRFQGRERLGWNSGREFFTTREMLELEARNLARLRGLASFQSVTSSAEICAYLKGLAGGAESDLSPEEGTHLDAFRAGAASALCEAPVAVSPGQREHIVNDLAGSRGFAVTQGDPGTGKTFAAAIVERFNSEVLEPSGRRHLTINLAYTGKASLETEKASGKNSFTIDSFLTRVEESPSPATVLGVSPDPALPNQVVIKIDEASLVGGRQAGRILTVVSKLKEEGFGVKLSLIGDSKQMQSIQASPFFRHASDLAREASGDYAVMKEITRQKESGLLAVARVLNRTDPERPLGNNAADALKMLQQQGRVTEIPERPELVKAVVERYLSETAPPSPSEGKHSVLIVTPFNADRHDLNREIRQAKMQNGELGESVTVQVLVPVEQGVTASSYHPGMTVIFTGARSGHRKLHPPEGMRANQKGEVLAVNPGTNRVKIGFTDGQSRIFDATDLAQQSSTYRSEQREFAKGDLVVFSKNSRDRKIITTEGEGKSIGVRNGERGEIADIHTTDKETIATIKMLSDGRKIYVQLTRFGPQHIDHGYAVTVHKGQGETVDSVISFNYVKPASSNDKNRLQSLTRLQISDEAFNRWNSRLSELEKSYETNTRIGGHAGRISFVLLADRQNPGEQKGIAITFRNGRDVVEDESVRSQMREAGMYWSTTAGAWVTAATNDSALHLIPGHPLKDRQYLEHLKTFRREQPSPPPGPEERSYTAEIDTMADTIKYGRASYNSFNVAVTRARHEAAVFTNSIPGLRNSIQVVDQKSSTIERLDRSRPDIGKQPSPAIVKAPELEKELKLPKR